MIAGGILSSSTGTEETTIKFMRGRLCIFLTITTQLTPVSSNPRTTLRRPPCLREGLEPVRDSGLIKLDIYKVPPESLLAVNLP